MEVAVLHSPSLLVRRVSVDVEQHWTSEAPTLPPTALNKHSVHRVRHCYSFNKHPTHNVYINKGSEIIVNARCTNLLLFGNGVFFYFFFLRFTNLLSVLFMILLMNFMHSFIIQHNFLYSAPSQKGRYYIIPTHTVMSLAV